VNYCLNNPDTNVFTSLRDSNGMPVPNNPTVVGWCAFLQLFVVTPALAVAYCQLVDKSMFKHRIAYRIISPVHKMLGRCPWVVLISLVLLPIFFYIQMTVVQV
jgi:ABC-type methionine transport system permease subunit